jgi:hypothetical protein
MKALSILTLAAGLVVAISAPSLAASRTQAHRSNDAYSSYARDTDNAFWAQPYVYAPYSGPSGPARVQGRDPEYPSGMYRYSPSQAPVGSTRNDW